MFNDLNLKDLYDWLVALEYSTGPASEVKPLLEKILASFKTKYGEDDFRVKEVFAQIQAFDLEKIRYIVHADLDGCQPIDEEGHGVHGYYCQHCDYLTSVKKNWELKLKDVSNHNP